MEQLPNHDYNNLPELVSQRTTESSDKLIVDMPIFDYVGGVCTSRNKRIFSDDAIKKIVEELKEYASKGDFTVDTLPKMEDQHNLEEFLQKLRELRPGMYYQPILASQPRRKLIDSSDLVFEIDKGRSSVDFFDSERKSIRFTVEKIRDYGIESLEGNVSFHEKLITEAAQLNIEYEKKRVNKDEVL